MIALAVVQYDPPKTPELLRPPSRCKVNALCIKLPRSAVAGRLIVTSPRIVVASGNVFTPFPERTRL